MDRCRAARAGGATLQPQQTSAPLPFHSGCTRIDSDAVCRTALAAAVGSSRSRPRHRRPLAASLPHPPPRRRP
ncbi:hypothetical protein BDA96_09G021700 [Sorghum bicolor]|uniref:Uncharacterized protein n=2 Tax=Sorghum bicolor TaxID=4558 RepID=A0A921Q9A9_SORBI|nr:hypothetical protein BDA96_09G021700 [Sorghum bicolor]OQU77269.1 hypothetical protein SORBI_3009G020950 [Sorghum bicolor]